MYSVRHSSFKRDDELLLLNNYSISFRLNRFEIYNYSNNIEVPFSSDVVGWEGSSELALYKLLNTNRRKPRQKWRVGL